jgi:hypothetical protein
MRRPVEVKVSNETLLGLTDRLSAAAAVPIVVPDPIVREMRVSADLSGVPLYRALEKVASQANLVIEPRTGGGVTLQLRDQNLAAPGEKARQDAASSLWSPAWGTLPRTGFGLTLARSPEGSNREEQRVGGRTAAGGGPGAARTEGAPSDKPVAASQRRVLAAEDALSAQNQQTFQRAAGQLGGLTVPAPITHCPYCHRPLTGKETYLCPKCRKPVKATDLKCPACGEPTPAHCPQCRQPLAVPPKGK